MKLLSNSILKSCMFYLFSVFTCIVFLIFFLELWKADLSVPFDYNADGLFSAVTVKGLIENGWYLNNKFLGAPFGFEMYDFPTADSFHFVILKCISYFTPNPATVINLYYLLTFPATTIISLYVMKKMKFTNNVSLIGSLLFTFVPFHFLRGEAHLFFSAYYLIPIIILISIDIMSVKTKLTRKSFYLKLIFCILMSCYGVYYAFFTSFIFIVAGLTSSYRYRTWYQLKISLIFVVCIGLGVIMNISPSLYNNYINDKNSVVAARDASHSEILGLKISQLILPIDNHRVGLFNKIKSKYNSTAPLVNENGFASLGFAISLGFIFLLLVRFRMKKERSNEFLNQLSVLNLSLVLLCTIGGFGTLFALLVSPSIRGLNRVSIIIAFISILALALFIEKYKFKMPKYLFNSLIFMFLLLSLLDQTSKNYVPNYEATKNEFSIDKEFVVKIESGIPVGNSPKVFQLPYLFFPESSPINKMGGYDHFKMYLHSNYIAWSFGAMQGRDSDIWQKSIVEKPIKDFLDALSLGEFTGLYLDRNGYEDNGKKIENDLFNFLGSPSIVSSNNRKVYYDLSNYTENLKKSMTQSEFIKKKELALYPMLDKWNGCYEPEKQADRNWRWCTNKAQLKISNSSPSDKNITVSMTVFSGYDEPSQLNLNSYDNNETITFNSKGSNYSRKILVSSGQNYIINITTDSKKVDAKGDPRNDSGLYLRIENLNIE